MLYDMWNLRLIMSENQLILNIKNILLLCITIAVYSMSDLFSKLASGCDFLSGLYFVYLSGAVLVLVLYALLWQMVLKRIPLNKAYMFRSLGVVYGLGIAFLVFHENITWLNILGSALVLSGLLILLSDSQL